MTQAGWLFMIGSWTIILVVAGFCFYKILNPSEAEKAEKTDNADTA